jgi:hypothetical protein
MSLEILQTLITRVDELENRLSEIISSERPNRIKLIRVTHIRKQLAELQEELNAYSPRS